MDLVQKIARWYFTPKWFEGREIYEHLGVKIFKERSVDFMVRHVWGSDLQKEKKSLEEHVRLSENLETAHIIFYDVMIYQTLMNLVEREYADAAVNIGINLVLNIYPIMFQRYNRPRLARVLEKMRNKNEIREG